MPKAEITVKDIMTRKVVSVAPETSLVEAANILAEHSFDGVPVVDSKNKLVGIITEYDLIEKSSDIHLPTFQKILQNLKVLRSDRSEFEKEVKKVSSLTVEDVMNPEPLTLSDTASFEEVVRAFKEHHRVNPIPIVDKSEKVVGVVSRFDVLKPLRSL